MLYLWAKNQIFFTPTVCVFYAILCDFSCTSIWHTNKNYSLTYLVSYLIVTLCMVHAVCLRWCVKSVFDIFVRFSEISSVFGVGISKYRDINSSMRYFLPQSADLLVAVQVWIQSKNSNKKLTGCVTPNRLYANFTYMLFTGFNAVSNIDA